jgi:hypothetical protein
MAAIGQTDQVTAIFPVDWNVVRISKPNRKIQIMPKSTILYHHFFLLVLSFDSSAIQMSLVMVLPENNKRFAIVSEKKE